MIPSRPWTLYVSLLLTVFVFVRANLVPKWGEWYSCHLPYRWQTERLLHGQVALATVPSGMDWDLAWGNGTVQQVWGLAVPFWRLPFEALARLLGQPALPDRFAFAAALIAVSYLILRFQSLFASQEKTPSGSGWAYIALTFTVLFPPFLSLCSSRFLVYEEAEAYGFITCLLLMVWTAWLWLRPRPTSFLGLALAAGLTPLIRPTLGVYGFASIVVAGIAFWQRGRGLRLLCLGGTLFCVGFGLLLWSNAERFGSPLEFGYSLNINSDAAMAYASRFSNPFRTEPVNSAAREMSGVLFLSKFVGLIGHSGTDMFPGQSPTFRWRELYFSVYDLSTFVMITAAWGWLLWRIYRRAKRGERLNQTWVLEIIGLWALLATIPLAVFYLRFPFISSRYLLDFGPAFAAASWVFYWLVLTRVWSHRGNLTIWKTVCVAVCFCGWWGYEMAAARNTPNRWDRSWTWKQVASQMEMDDSRPLSQPLPALYTNGYSLKEIGIPFNGSGWDSETGNTEACVSLFVENPECLILELAPAKGANVADKDYNCIQAKIGLEFLERQSLTPTPEGMKIVFRRPREKQYQTGIQLASLAMMSPQELNTGDSKFRLLKVSWHQEAEGQAVNGVQPSRVSTKPANPQQSETSRLPVLRQ